MSQTDTENPTYSLKRNVRHTEEIVYVTDNYSQSPLCLLVNESQLQAEHKVALCIFSDFVSVRSYLVRELGSVSLFHTLTVTDKIWPGFL